MSSVGEYWEEGGSVGAQYWGWGVMSSVGAEYIIHALVLREDHKGTSY